MRSAINLLSAHFCLFFFIPDTSGIMPSCSYLTLRTADSFYLALECNYISIRVYAHISIHTSICTYTHIPIPNCKSVYPQSLILSEHQRFMYIWMRNHAASQSVNGKSCRGKSDTQKKRVDRSTAVCYYT